MDEVDGAWDQLLNFSTPFAPRTAEDAAARITGVRAREADPAGGEAVSETVSAVVGDERDWTAGEAVSTVGEDATRVVRVVVDGEGWARELRVDASWRKAVGIKGLGAAVVEAASDASSRRMDRLAEDLSEGRGEFHPGRVGEGTRPAGGVDRESLRRVFGEVLEELDRKIEEVRALPRVVRVQNRRWRSAAGRIELVMNGTLMVEVEADQSWLRGADDAEICLEFTRAFTDAREGFEAEDDPLWCSERRRMLQPQVDAINETLEIFGRQWDER